MLIYIFHFTPFLRNSRVKRRGAKNQFVDCLSNISSVCIKTRRRKESRKGERQGENFPLIFLLRNIRAVQKLPMEKTNCVFTHYSHCGIFFPIFLFGNFIRCPLQLLCYHPPPFLVSLSTIYTVSPVYLYYMRFVYKWNALL